MQRLQFLQGLKSSRGGSGSSSLSIITSPSVILLPRTGLMRSPDFPQSLQDNRLLCIEPALGWLLCCNARSTAEPQVLSVQLSALSFCSLHTYLIEVFQVRGQVVHHPHGEISGRCRCCCYVETWQQRIQLLTCTPARLREGCILFQHSCNLRSEVRLCAHQMLPHFAGKFSIPSSQFPLSAKQSSTIEFRASEFSNASSKLTKRKQFSKITVNPTLL